MDGRKNTEHDNIGITRTFEEVDSVIPSDLPKPPDARQTTNLDSAVESSSTTATAGKKKELGMNRMRYQAKTDYAKREDEKVEPASDNTASPQDDESFSKQFDGRDVCLEQLYDLMDDTFDGNDSNRSYLAYCLDAQSKQWKHKLRHFYP